MIVKWGFSVCLIDAGISKCGSCVRNTADIVSTDYSRGIVSIVLRLQFNVTSLT